MIRETESRLSGRTFLFLFSAAAVALIGLSGMRTANAGVVVNDTWIDGTDDDPASPVFSENGVDVDNDGDIESVWFQGGGGELNPAGPGGPLQMVLDGGPSGTSSSSWTTYFTPEGSEVNLAAPGQTLRLTWIFSTNDVNASNGSQNFRLALVDSPASSRIDTNGTPGNAAYKGYGIFANMGETFGHSDPFELVERTNPDLASALLSSSGSWEDDDLAAKTGTNGNHGYDDNTTYTLIMELTRTPADELTVSATISGGTINGTGSMTVTSTDPTPQSFIYDTFALRPSSAATTTDQFDTHLFRVQLVPEPASALLFALGAACMAFVRRRAE